MPDSIDVSEMFARARRQGAHMIIQWLEENSIKDEVDFSLLDFARDAIENGEIDGPADRR